MKILATEYNAQGQRVIVPIGDNALLRNNDDFYLPDFATELSCIPQLVIRIHKLGKCIEERFCDRYYREIGVGIRFYADRLEEDLQQMKLPAGIASAFDGSAAISALCARESLEGTDYALRINGEVVFEGNSQALPCSVDQLISDASFYYTLKIGDYLYCGNLFRYRGLKIGDRLQVSFQGKVCMDFKLK